MQETTAVVMIMRTVLTFGSRYEADLTAMHGRETVCLQFETDVLDYVTQKVKLVMPILSTKLGNELQLSDRADRLGKQRRLSLPDCP
jgi:hypothetical protein